MKIETLVQIMAEEVDHYDTSAQGLIHAAKRILAALEAERVGGVVIAEGQFSTTDDWELFVSPRDGATCNCEFTRLDGKKGSLIFRPEVER